MPPRRLSLNGGRFFRIPNSRASSTAAIENRKVRNSRIEISATACLTTMKVEPQMQQTMARTTSACVRRSSLFQITQQQARGQQNALQSEFAALGMEPFLRRVRASAGASGANRDGGDVHGEGYVRVGG